MKTEQLALQKISLEDERFRTSYHFSLEKLKLSLKKIGLLHPPLVTRRDKRFILVSGWKRVLACRELSFSTVPVDMIEEKDELQTFLIAFYENLSARDFGLLEKAEALSRLRKFGEDETKIIRHYLPLLGIPQTLSHLDTYLAFSGLDPGVKKAAHEKNMPFPVLKLFSEFTSEEQRLLLPFILPLGQNKRKAILEDFMEISRRNDIPMKNLILSEEIQAIQSTDELTPLQKADKIRLLLRKQRYPVFSSWKDSFDSLLRRMRWPDEVSVDPSPFFEDENFTVTFTFQDQEQFRSNLKKLEELSSKDEFVQIFKLR
jgi:hypothetical protein